MQKINFSADEQKVISDALVNLSSILLNKIIEGYTTPTIKGSLKVDSEKKIINFEISAKHTTNENT